ncbi:MAG TPA: hypothetical protein VM661_13530 [Candidatus Sulfotelmatobacter sp.]|jgi:hypothetical protein|nr:hypothetical protein [Candidatus Sulfotelmatobacter sp.]
MSARCPRLLVSLTPHGYGHAAMTAPLVEALRRARPDLRLTLQTSIARDWLEGRYSQPFELITDTPDFGMAMDSAVAVLPEASHRRYLALHDRLEAVVDAEAERMRALAFDLVLSNVSYVALLAARRAGIPALAMSCLNWHIIYGAYCRHLPGAEAVLEQMHEGYAGAQAFLRPAPSIPMPDLANARPIGPLARRGTPMRSRLRQEMGAGEGERIGLIAFGGMDMPLDFSRWPRLPGWKWLISGDSQGHPDMVVREDVSMGFTDLLASCDLIIGKPGYGTFSEAGVNGVPMLYLPRPDWPEAPHLCAWLETHGRAAPVGLSELFDKASLNNQLQKLFSIENKVLPLPSGIEDGVFALLKWLPPRGDMQK